MKKSWILSLGVFGVFYFSLAGDSYAVEKKTFTLKEDLAIGIDSGDDNLMFAGVSDIGLDEAGNIFILDWENSRIQKFDSRGKFLKTIILKKGQGPEEVAGLGGAAVGPSGMIAVLDRGGNKVLILGPEGEFRSFFKLDFQATYLGCLENDEVVVLGLNEDKILHLFEKDGRLVSSFGDPFEAPSQFSKYKDMPMMRCPMRFSCSPQGDIFVFNPHKFEISVYRESRLLKKLTGKSDLFVPLRVPEASARRIALRFPFLTILKSGNRLYVTVFRPEGEGPNDLIVFEDDKPVASLPITGMPRAVDGQGRLYCAQETDFPRLARYVISEKR
ncbi:MAG: 6-bladed beta-propeller [Candidatus Aminicenantales bacterium]